MNTFSVAVGKVIETLAPAWALRRAQARHYLRTYTHAKDTEQQAVPRDTRSANAVAEHARDGLRRWARHLDENYDFAHSVLNTLVDRVWQIDVMPAARRVDGELAVEFNEGTREAFEDWCRRGASDHTSICDQASLVGRSLYRDGEAFVLPLLLAPDYRYPTPIPFAVLALEADYLPYDATAVDTTHGIATDQWGAPIAYHFWKEHPGNSVWTRMRPMVSDEQLVVVPAEQVTHLAMRTRLGQLRGHSVFAPAIGRLADVKDYDESERLAAAIASNFCAVLRRPPQFGGAAATATTSGYPSLSMTPGMILDGGPADGIDILNPSRPNPELTAFQKYQRRSVAAASRASYSSAARDYDGTYSSQRQELVEVEATYQLLREYAIGMYWRPVYEQWVAAARLAGVLEQRDASPDTLVRATYLGQPIPQIDAQKESAGQALELEMGIESRHGLIRRRGRDPVTVDREIDADSMLPDSGVAQNGQDQQADGDQAAA